MAEAIELAVQNRETRGSHEARRLRRQGRVPGVIYGHKEETLAVALSGEELEKAVRHGVRVLDLKTDAKKEKVLIREIQWDHLGKELLHVDFARVAADERIHLTVPLEIRGTAPGASTGGVVDQPMHSLMVECLAIAIPESIRVNISELQVGQAIHVRDLKLPEGVQAMVDPDAIVVQVRAQLAEAEAAPAPAAEIAEPEVIGRQAKPGEEEEGEKK